MKSRYSFKEIRCKLSTLVKKIVTNQLALDKIKTLDIKKYNQKIVLVKGCSDVDISSDLYVEITKLLLPVVKKLMFGEACSSVPIYMKKK